MLIFLRYFVDPALGSITSDSSSSSLPLTIGVPACFALIVVTIAIILLQRRKKCNNTSNVNKGPRFNAVPTTETESFPSVHAANHPTNLHVNPMHGVQHPNLFTGVSNNQYTGVSNNQYNTGVPNNQYAGVSNNPMFPSSMGSSKNHSLDFYTDISSVSQKQHHHYHHNTPQFSSSQYSS